MPPLRHALAGRRPRRRRVVTAAADAPVLIGMDAEELYGYAAGLQALPLLAQYEPAFFAAHVAELPITPPQLLGCGMAWLQLVGDRGLPLRPLTDVMGMGEEIPHETTPLDTLLGFNGVMPELLQQLGRHLDRPLVSGVGYGMELLLESGGTDDALALMLYHLYQDTSLSTGVKDAARALAAEGEDDDLVLDIVRLKPLPAATDMRALAAALDLTPFGVPPTVTTWNVLAYPVAQTDARYANVNDAEIEMIWEGDDPTEGPDWDDLDDAIAEHRQARAIESAYSALAARVADAPRIGLQLYAAIWRAARSLTPRSAALIDILEPTL